MERMGVLRLVQFSRITLGTAVDIFKYIKMRVKKGLWEKNKSKGETSYKPIFDYFSFWQTQFKVDGKTYGGATDYSKDSISLLNLSDLKEFIDFENRSVLELAPLEGGNTIKLCRMGVRHVTAVEGRPENFIKCCIIKNIYGLDRARFALDDVRNISREKYGRFDIGFVAGILYHLDDPHLLLKKLAEITDTLLIATHYADEISPTSHSKVVELKTDNGVYRGKNYSEGAQLNINSGFQPNSFWPFEEDLFQMCKDVGYKRVTMIRKNPVPTDKFKLIYLKAEK